MGWPCSSCEGAPLAVPVGSDCTGNGPGKGANGDAVCVGTAPLSDESGPLPLEVGMEWA